LPKGRDHFLFFALPTDAGNTFTTKRSLIFDRGLAACTLYNSPAKNNRPVVLVAGGVSQNTAEILDYTDSTAVWEESKQFCDNRLIYSSKLFLL